MKKILLLFIVIFSNTQQLLASSESVIDFDIATKGYRLKTASAIKDYNFIPYRLDPLYLTKQIKRVNHKLSKLEINELAKSISLVTNCLGIDAYVLTALIQKESSFEKTATSHTNAAGLTQFTTAGINEVHDQLGLNGSKGAPIHITDYYRTKVLTCINPNWVDPWLLIVDLPGERHFINQIKEVLKQDVLIAITYGAILLKTYVANMDNRNLVNGLGHTTAEIYFYALQNYNGEPGEAKVRYAQTVFKHIQEMHPKPNVLDFPFIY